jgi:hypothetical protein
MVGDAMRFKAAASMIATHILVEITEAMRLTLAGIAACVVMEQQGAGATQVCVPVA